MLTLEKVIAMMRDNQYPCWSLTAIPSRDRVKAGSWSPVKKGREITDEEDTPSREMDANVEASIKHLESTLDFWRTVPNTIFEIIIKRYAGSNQGGHLMGPLKFCLDEKAQAQNTPALGAVLPNHIDLMEKVYDRRFEVEKLHNIHAVDKAEFFYEKKREWDKIDAAKEEIKKEKEELARLKAIYEDHGERAKYGFVRGFNQIFEQFAPKEGEKGIGAVQTQVQEIPPTEEEKLIESLAGEIHKNVKDSKEIKVIGAMVMKFIKSPEDEIFQRFRNNLSTTN
jgi:hypothetical protein